MCSHGQQRRAPTLNRGQKSCTLKHLAVLRRVAKEGWQRSLVLEDDVVLARDFREGVRAALAETSDASGPFVIYLGAGGNFYTPASRWQPGRRICEASKGRFSDFYIIGAEAARLRLERMEAGPVTRRRHISTMSY